MDWGGWWSVIPVLELLLPPLLLNDMAWLSHRSVCTVAAPLTTRHVLSIHGGQSTHGWFTGKPR